MNTAGSNYQQPKNNSITIDCGGNKKEYYKKLHQRLANEYATKPIFIERMRSAMIGQKMTLEEYLEAIRNAVHKTRWRKNKRQNTRQYGREHYRQQLGFLGSLLESDINYILEAK